MKGFSNMSIWNTLEQADKLATLEINSWHCSLTDPVWAFFSDIPVWIPLYVAIVAFLIYRLGWKKGLLVVAGALLTFGFCDQFSNLVKGATERLRPLHDAYMIHNGLHVLENGGKYSFFSAHAANAFGLATCTLIGLRSVTGKKYNWYAISMYIWATLVAVSRIFVGKHFLGDVIVGTCVGLLAGYAFGSFAKVAIAKFCK